MSLFSEPHHQAWPPGAQIPILQQVRCHEHACQPQNHSQPPFWPPLSVPGSLQLPLTFNSPLSLLHQPQKEGPDPEMKMVPSPGVNLWGSSREP